MSMERFGELLLMERLASGGMAEVFRAKQLGYAGFEKTVAVKRILPHFASSDDFKSMFRVEANLSAMLQHPNITQVFSNGENEGYLYLVMEFVDGKNLRQLLARADKVKLRIPIEVSCYIVSEALKGLDYAHNYHDERTGEALSIVHRDVSPQNVMLGYEGGIKIVDFGIAKAASKSESTRAGVLKGKFGYMSPEQARGETLDRRSDIFSIGIILWELITQRRLFTYEDELKTLEKVRECKVPRPSEKNPTVPYALEKIVMRALDKESTNRYDNCSEFYSDLVRYMNDRHPNFIATDFTKFMKEFYKEEIADDKKRREKLNLEAPAFMAENPQNKKTSSRKEKTATHTDTGRDADTQVSDIRKANTGIANVPKILNEASPMDMRGTLNQDSPTTSAAQSSSRNMGTNFGVPKRIQVISAAPGENSQIANIKFAKKNSKMKLVRASAVISVLAISTYSVLTYAPEYGPKVIAFIHTQRENQQNATPTNVATTPTNPSGEGATNVQANNSSSEENVTPSSDAQREPASMFMWEPRKYVTYGTVSINGVPDADVLMLNGKQFVDSAMNALRTPLRDIKLPPGKYEMVLKNSVFGVSKTVNFEVQQNKSQKIEAILNKR